MRNCSSHRDSVPCGSGKRTKKILPISEDVRGKRQSKDNELAIFNVSAKKKKKTKLRPDSDDGFN